MDRPNQKTWVLQRFKERIEELDLSFLARDVEPFLFASEQQGGVAGFRDFGNNRKDFQ